MKVKVWGWRRTWFDIAQVAGLAKPAALGRPALWVLVAWLALAGCVTEGVPPTGADGGVAKDGGAAPSDGGAQSVSQQFAASQGGYLEVAGASILIPPGALTADATVTLSVEARSSTPAESPLRTVGPSVTVDVAAAALQAAAKLRLPFDPTGTDADGLLVEERNDDPSPEKPGGYRLHAGTRFGDTLEYGALRAGVYAVAFVAEPQTLCGADGGFQCEDGRPELQVHYYWQLGWGWCSPTAMAMTMNFFEPLDAVVARGAPSGYVSNYFLASQSRQDACQGYWPDRHLADLAVPASLYEARRWDADLIPSNPFTRYVRAWLNGFSSEGGRSYPARPVQTSSDRNVHAFVATGADANRIYLHDSNVTYPVGGSPGTIYSLTWQEFRDGNCLNPRTPDGGPPACPGDTGEELSTVVITARPRPERERRGSIELAPAGMAAPFCGNGTSGVDNLALPGRALRFVDHDDRPIARWQWDGSPYQYGYFFDDPANALPDDTDFGNVIPRTAKLQARFKVVNVTTDPRIYRATARLSFVSPPAIRLRSVDVTVPGYSSAPVDLDFESFVEYIGRVTTPTEGRLQLVLLESDVTQDIKEIRFRVGPSPNIPPRIAITGPGTSATRDLNRAFTVMAQASDVEDGASCCNITWDPVPTGTVSTGPSVSYLFTTVGTRVITATARDSDNSTASATATIEIVNSAPQPVITNPSSAGQPVYRGAQFTLNGYATDRNEGPGPEDGLLPCGRLRWTSSDSGDSGLPATGCSAPVTFTTNGTRTLTLTATDPQGLTGTTTRTVTVGDPPADSPPSARITNPANGMHFVDNLQTISLSGTASDPEGQSTTVTWRAEWYQGALQSAQIGTGLSASWRPVDSGISCSTIYYPVTIRLFATDPMGNTGQDSIQILLDCPPP
jgi:hypothetical protein